MKSSVVVINRLKILILLLDCVGRLMREFRYSLLEQFVIIHFSMQKI